MKMPLTSTLIASAVALATLTGAAQAKGRLVVYCSATNEMCETETKEFGEKYDVKPRLSATAPVAPWQKSMLKRKTHRLTSGTAAL